MDNLYKNQFEFLDFTNLDAHSRDELTTILNYNGVNDGAIKLPWDKGENNTTVATTTIYNEVPPPEQIEAQPQLEPKVWQPYEVEGNVMKFEPQTSASSSVLVTLPSTLPYSQQIIQPMYQDWNTNQLYIANNIVSDPNVHSYIPGHHMAYPTANMYQANNENQEMIMRDGVRRGGRGRNTKNYARNMNHTAEIQPSYMSDHGQYQISMQPYQQYYQCIQDPSVASQQHAASGQPIYYPSTAIYAPTMAQQTHRADYLPPTYHHQSPTNTNYGRQSQNLLPQTNGESSKSTNNHKTYEKRMQNVNITKPSIHQTTLDDDNNSSQTNIVTTVIVNNRNIESSSTNEVDENLIAANNNNINNNNNNNNSNNNAPATFDLKIEQRVSMRNNDNYKGIEKDDTPCVNIKSSIEVKQNGNDIKEYEETVSHVITPTTITTSKAAASITDEVYEIKEVKEINEVKETLQTENIVTEISEISEKPTSTAPIVPVSTASKSWASLLKNPADDRSVAPLRDPQPTPKPTAHIAPNNAMNTNSKPQSMTITTPVEKTHSTSESWQNKLKLYPITEDAQQKNDMPSEPCKPLQTEVPQLHCDDPITYRMGEFLLSYQMDPKTVSLLPRGLTNRSNYCYINSILQALLACPPFYNLLVALPYSKNPSKHSPSPLIDNMIKFAREFTPLPEGARLARRDRAQKRNEDAVSDIQSGVPFEPSYIYTILKNTSSPGVFSVEGRQEDAEEFLSCLLNGITDEMLELMKLASNNDQKSIDCMDTTNVNYTQDEEEWKVMGPKNKGSITRSTDFGRTPLSDIFRGQLRSRVSRATEQATDYVQPFFTLQLDIEKAESVRSALEILVGKDQLEGMTCSKTKQQIEAWKQVTLEELPVILILHLKWFDYKPDGCSKILKCVDFPIDLKIDNKLMSTNSRPKLSQKQRQYKLFAVTYHDGKEATKGHYVTDAFHVGYGGWVRYDDSSLKGVSEANVLNPLPPRVPYLLYYRRCDTIGNNQSNNNNNNNNVKAR